MKRIALTSALLLALSPMGAAYAQIAASIVTNATSDATLRTVTEAVRSATQNALKSDQKVEAIKPGDIKAHAKKPEVAVKKSSN